MNAGSFSFSLSQFERIRLCRISWLIAWWSWGESSGNFSSSSNCNHGTSAGFSDLPDLRFCGFEVLRTCLCICSKIHCCCSYLAMPSVNKSAFLHNRKHPFNSLMSKFILQEFKKSMIQGWKNYIQFKLNNYQLFHVSWLIQHNHLKHVFCLYLDSNLVVLGIAFYLMTFQKQLLFFSWMHSFPMH